MANLTKKAIMNSFMRLLGEKPLDKITIKDIVEDCDITRRTFYYHYQDIYALVEDLFVSETQKVVSEYSEGLKWEQGFIAAARFVLDNRHAVYHLYNSARRDELEKYLLKIAESVMNGFIDDISEGLQVTDEDRELVADFYTFALVGLLKNWLNGGMKEDPERLVNRIGVLFDGNIRRSLKRSDEDFHKNG